MMGFNKGLCHHFLMVVFRFAAKNAKKCLLAKRKSNISGRSNTKIRGNKWWSFVEADLQ